MLLDLAVVLYLFWRYGYKSQDNRHILAGKIWAGIESYVGFLPKPSQDRARTAEHAGVSLLTGNWERARGHGFKSRPARHQ